MSLIQGVKIQSDAACAVCRVMGEKALGRRVRHGAFSFSIASHTSA
jgi:hypothetical protein